VPYDASTTHKTTLDGFTYVQSLTDPADGFEGVAVNVPAAKAGTLTAANQVTLSPGHGITSGENLNVYWAGGAARKLVPTVAGNVVTLGAAADGDPLPAVGTPVTVARVGEVSQVLAFDGNRCQAICVYGAAPGYVTFVAGASEIPFRVRTAGEGPVWSKSSGATNPLAGVTVNLVMFSHSSTSPRDMRAGLALD
jgi:hypothetical protein